MDAKYPQEIPAEIRTFLEVLLREAKIGDVDEKTREDLIQELFYQLDNYLTSVIVDSLKPEDLETFIKMNEEKKPKEEIEAFIKEKLPDAENLFTDAFVEFKNLYLGNVDRAKEEFVEEKPQE